MHFLNQPKRNLFAVLPIALLFGVLLVAGVCRGGVQGSDHDLTGSSQDLCMTCHVPHNAQGSQLWAAVPSGTFAGVADLCYTCHDGSVTTIGTTTIFDTAADQHISVGSDCSGDGACHNVHQQNPNNTGRFVVLPETNHNYCESCHGATPFPGAEGLGDHTAGATHFSNAAFTCDACHSVHGAVVQTEVVAGLTNPILLGDNHNGSFYGTFCISCHNGNAPDAAVAGTGGFAANDVFDYEEAVVDGTETKHPTTSVGTTYPVEGCDKCHDVHDPGATAYGYLLLADNTNSAYCVSCHDGSQAPAVGANTHFTGVPNDVGMNSGLTPALPWADQINEDAFPGFDWLAATPNLMVCETCHSVHRAGWTSTDGEYLLRHPNGDQNHICTDCHTAN